VFCCQKSAHLALLLTTPFHSLPIFQNNTVLVVELYCHCNRYNEHRITLGVDWWFARVDCFEGHFVAHPQFTLLGREYRQVGKHMVCQTFDGTFDNGTNEETFVLQKAWCEFLCVLLCVYANSLGSWTIHYALVDFIASNGGDIYAISIRNKNDISLQ
jgi:hypothetical protein